MSYVTTFLNNIEIKLPKINSKYHKNYCELNYTHFSILYSKDRKQPICAAVNVDGENYFPFDRGNDVWKHDQKVIGYQIAEQFYPKTNQEFHKGHIVRRLDPCWGNETISKKAEEDTFHYTNASPQHRKFNPKIWLELEKNLLEKGAVSLDQKISVFSGPVLNPIDKPYNNPLVEEEILIPSHFWKIVMWKKTNGKIYAVGFMQSQKEYIDKLVYQNVEKAVFRDHDDYYENIKFKGDAVYQVNISLIEKVTGLKFQFEAINLPNVKNDSMQLIVEKVYTERDTKSRFRSETDNVYQISGFVLE